jgi:hypothetical protein
VTETTAQTRRVVSILSHGGRELFLQYNEESQSAFFAVACMLVSVIEVRGVIR